MLPGDTVRIDQLPMTRPVPLRGTGAVEDTNSPALPATPMLSYIARRILYMALLLLALSFFSFVLIELPPGTFLDNLIQQLRNQGVQVDLEEIRTLEERYGLNLPFLSRYGMWMRNLARGDMGDSLAYNQPVTQTDRPAAVAHRRDHNADAGT